MHLLGLWHTSSGDPAGSLFPPSLQIQAACTVGPCPQACSPTSTPWEPQPVALWCCRVPRGQPWSQILNIPSSAEPAASRSAPFFLWPIRLSFFSGLLLLGPSLLKSTTSHSWLQCSLPSDASFFFNVRFSFLKYHGYSVAQEKSVRLVLATGQQFKKPLNSTFKAF